MTFTRARSVCMHVLVCTQTTRPNHMHMYVCILFRGEREREKKKELTRYLLGHAQTLHAAHGLSPCTVYSHAHACNL